MSQATLIDPKTGQKRVVTSGSPEASQLMGQGFQLMTGANAPAPTPPKAVAPNTPQTSNAFLETGKGPQPFQYPDMGVFGTAMNEMRSKLTKNNDLLTQKATILKQLYDRPLSDEELKVLSPSQASAVRSGNRALIDMEVRLINDQVQGRNNTLDQGINYITNLYSKEKDDQATKFQDAQKTVQSFVAQYGSNAGAALKSLYGPQKIAELKAMGIDVDAFASAAIPSVAQQKIGAQYGSGTGTYTLGTGTSRMDRNNNPTAFTIDIAKSGGLIEGVDYVQGDAFTDSNGKTLYTAKLLADPVDATKRVIDKIGFYTASGAPRWSYVNQIPDAKNWINLTNEQKTNVIQQMYQFEGGTGSVTPNGQVTAEPPDPTDPASNKVNAATGLTPNALWQDAIQYALTGKLPSLGLGNSTQTKNARFAIQNQAGAVVAAAGTTLPQLEAEYKANSTALSKILPIYNQTSVNEQNAIKNFSLLVGLAKKMDANTFQTSIPAINAWLRTGQVKTTGNKDVNNFLSALIPTLTEYAKVVTGQTGGAAVTDAARSEMKTMLNAGLNADAIESFVNSVAIPDMNNRTSSYLNQINGISTTLGSFLSAVTPTSFSASSATPATPIDSQNATTTSDSTFMSDLKGAAPIVVTSRNPRSGEMTREQIISRLAQEYPSIPQRDIAAIVYSTYPDKYR